jgi:phosphatidylinositol alpha 1,6-mannosyltransferase
MRIAIVTESFLPDINGVAHSVVRVAEQLLRRGHAPVVVAPEPGHGQVAPELPYPVVRVPSVPLPVYRSLRVAMSARRVRDVLVGHEAEVVHLASPYVLGARAGTVARQLGLPTVAVYQTDLPAYAASYRLRDWGEAAAWRWLRRVHNNADRTLAPSSASAAALHEHGVQRVWLWGRGVDAQRFHPAHRSAALRRELAPGGELLVGYVGRLAAEKRVDLLAETSRLPGVRLVVVGDGPAAEALRRQVPGAYFLGTRRGAQLARIYASLDVFVHPGPFETFGQTLQEAAASGLPVVAPAAGGPLDLVEPGVTGYLVPPLDGGALAGAVAALALDPQRRRAYGAAGRALVQGRTWAGVGDELLDHYAAAVVAVPADVVAA